MNIYEKMSAITQEVGAVAKNLEVGFGRSAYKAVSETDVLAAVKPLEAKYKVYSYPCSRKVIESGELTSIDKDGREKRQLYLRVETVYRFVNMEKPEEIIEITTYGDGVDPQDKAPGKAMTYGDKYALLKAYKIFTGEDPDAKASDELVGKGQAPQQPQLDENTPITETMVASLQRVCGKHIIPESVLAGRYGKKALAELTLADYRDFAKTGEAFLKGWDEDHPS